MKESTGKRIKIIMNERGLKQIDILKLCEPYCNQYGIKLAKNDLSQYINDKVQPKQNKLSILGLALNVSEAWLMGYDVPRNRIETKNQPAAPVSPSVAPVQLTSDESDLLNDYRTLNTEGKSYINRQMDYATKQAEFLKDTMFVTTETA